MPAFPVPGRSMHTWGDELRDFFETYFDLDTGVMKAITATTLNATTVSADTISGTSITCNAFSAFDLITTPMIVVNGNIYSTSYLVLGATAIIISEGTAAPITGAYSRGSRVFNSSATVGQPKGWICTVTGTPGTWVSEGNL